MPLGQVVDYVIEHHNRQKRAEKEAEKKDRPTKARKATQADFDAYFG